MTACFDVVVVGLSSAGLYAAELLAAAGKRVGVFERRAEFAPARRTLIVTAELKSVIDVPDEAMLHRITTMKEITPRAQVTTPFREPDLIVERAEFGRVLARRARQAGVGLHYGHRFHSIEPHPEGARVQFHTGDGVSVAVVAGAVIGADGLFSDVARWVGIRRPPAVPILQAEVELPPGWDPAVAQCWFDVDDTRFFYWLIPESETHGVVGLVGDRRGETRALLDRFLARHGFTPLAYQGAYVAMHHPLLRPWAGVGNAPVYLVGDAAGQVKVTTVGGTVSGLLGAQAAARALINGTSYARELRPLRRELDLHWLIRLLLEQLDNPGYDALAQAAGAPKVREFLSRHNRDSMAGVFWKLMFEPRLWGVGLRCLVPLLLRRSRPGLSRRVRAEGTD